MPRLRRAGRWGATVPRPVGRSAWRALRKAILQRSLRPEERRELVPVWLWARPHVRARDAEALGSLALQMPEGAVAHVLQALAGVGLDAVPVLQTLEGTLATPHHRRQARAYIDALTAGSPRGQLSLADPRGGALSLAAHDDALVESSEVLSPVRIASSA